MGDYLRRAKVAGRTWPVRETIDDAGLERRLFPAPPSLAEEGARPPCPKAGLCDYSGLKGSDE